MIRRILLWLAVVAAAAAVVYGIFWVYEQWRAAVYAEGDRAGADRVQLRWDDDVKKRDAAKLAAVAAARVEEQEAARKAAQGEADARERAQAEAQRLAAAADRSRAAAGGLRDDLAALDRAARDVGVPSAAACPGEFARQRDHAIRARALLGACGDAYRVLEAAAGAERAALALQLDTALSWIRATGAPGSEQLSPP